MFPPMPAVHLLIQGKVQGVFFRASAKEVAEDLGISGWIKNTKEGAVECVADGAEAAIQQFVDWCKQGPSGARVDEVTVSQTDPIKDTGFRIVRF